ncbi:MAG: hypothetical protein WC222_01600 [Parachlamydiales bacterium]|jgi:hypothetical protein
MVTHNHDLSQNAVAFWHDTNLLSNNLEPKVAVIQNFSCSEISYLTNSLENLGFTLKDDGDFFVVLSITIFAKS